MQIKDAVELIKGLSEEELTRVRNGLEHSNLRRLESLLSRADKLNAYQHHFDEPDQLEQDLDRYRKATGRLVRTWARKVLDPGQMLTLRVLTADPRDARPATGKPREFSLPQPEEFELSNGLTVLHWRRGELPLLAVRLLLPGGSTSFWLPLVLGVVFAVALLALWVVTLRVSGRQVGVFKAERLKAG